MILDIVIIIIAFISLVFILRIIFKKSPVLSVIDPKKVPEEKEGKVKNEIIENRVKRKVFGFLDRMKTRTKPIYKKAEEKITSLYHQVLDKEKKYRAGLKKTPLTLEEKEEHILEIKDILTDAEKLFKQEKYQEAEKKCIEVLQLDKKNIEAYHLLGDIYVGMKDFDHARDVYKFLIKSNIKDHRAFSGLGYIATSLGDLDEAKEDFKQSIDIDNKVASYHTDLAKVYQTMGDSEKAISCCQEALALEPNNPKHLNLCLDISLEAKNKGLAIRTLDRLKKANPENQKLDELENLVNEL